MLTLNQIDALSNREPFTNGGSPHHCEEPEIITAIKRAGDRAEAYEIMLTPDLARQLLATMTHNRTESRDRIKSYCDLIKRGEWDFTGQGIVISRTGHLLDGQHRCKAVIESNIAVPILVVVNVDDDVWDHLDYVRARSSADNLTGLPNSKTVGAVLGLIYREIRTGLSTFGARGGNSNGAMPTYMSPVMIERFPDVPESVTFTRSCRGITADTLTMIQEAAEAAGITVSAWATERLVRAARQERRAAEKS